MRVQPSIQPYEQKMPDAPVGTVPTRGSIDAITLEQSRLPRNPLPDKPVYVRNGRIFYGYYCQMCHGAVGDGNGPVGESYIPQPADLSSPQVQNLPDGQLYLRMLTGVGHEPVMIQTVPQEQRWPLVMYVRTFGERGGTASLPD